METDIFEWIQIMEDKCAPCEHRGLGCQECEHLTAQFEEKYEENEAHEQALAEWYDTCIDCPVKSLGCEHCVNWVGNEIA